MNSIAHVGWDNSLNDRSRIEMVCGWLIAHQLAHLWALLPHDYINLNYGRDFLKESHQHTIVILHHLFDGEGLTRRERKGEFGESPMQLHAGKNARLLWLERLRCANARLIFAFGDCGEISAEYLREIPNYTLTKPSFGFGIYERTA